MIIFGSFLFILSFYFVNLIKNQVKIIKDIKIYLDNLKRIKNIKDNNMPLEEILNNISSSGIKLILKSFIIIIPYILNYLIFSYFGIPFLLNILFASAPYLYFFLKHD